MRLACKFLLVLKACVTTLNPLAKHLNYLLALGRHRPLTPSLAHSHFPAAGKQKAILLSEARAAATTSTLTFKTIFNAVKITVKMPGKELKRPEGKQITTKRTSGALTICISWHTIHTPAYLMPAATTRTKETGTAYSPGPLALLPLQPLLLPSSCCHPPPSNVIVENHKGVPCPTN